MKRCKFKKDGFCLLQEYSDFYRHCLYEPVYCPVIHCYDEASKFSEYMSNTIY